MRICVSESCYQRLPRAHYADTGMLGWVGVSLRNEKGLMKHRFPLSDHHGKAIKDSQGSILRGYPQLVVRMVPVKVVEAYGNIARIQWDNGGTLATRLIPVDALVLIRSQRAGALFS